MTQPPTGGPTQPPTGEPPRQDPTLPTAPSTPTPPSGDATSAPWEAAAAPQPALPAGPPAAAQPAGPPVSWQPVSGPPVAGYPFPGQPVPGHPAPPPAGYPFPGQPGSPVPPGGYPQYGPPAPRKKRGPLIALLVLAFVLLLCGGGGLAAFLLLRNTQTGEGAAEPGGAVDGFLTAVYTDQDATKAAGLVCVEARVPAEISKKVDEVKKYSVTYKNPRFSWTSPKVDSQSAGRAMVSVKLTMTTADEKTAQQQLTFTVLQKTGWWVCDVAAR